MRDILKKITELNRVQKTVFLIGLDSILILSALLASFSVRLGYLYWPRDELIWFVFASPLIAVPVFASFRMYKSVVRYIGFEALSAIVQAITLYSVVWGLFGYMAIIDGIPRSVILINWMFSLIAIISFRVFLVRIIAKKLLFNEKRKSNVIIYGAGSAGRQLSHALQLSAEYRHTAYIDDNIELSNSYINNIPVFLPEKIEFLIDKYKISEVLLAIPTISLKKQKEIVKKLSLLPIQVRSLPSLSDFAEGKVKIEDLLEIDIGDLLGRDSTKPNENLLKTKIFEKVVLITGAGGSIGSELCRQILNLKPRKLILFENNESALYHIEQELFSKNSSNTEIFPVLGSVTDYDRMKIIFSHYKVQTIYHAAAYKHVPLVEFNQSQGVLNNSIGTKLTAEAAISEKVETFVLISTDKAVRPTSVMGASKRIAELILQALTKNSNSTCLTMVRFGNVLDSSGSVIPLFKKQIRNGGPITVTDINMVRYFMTIPEAVELVIQAGAMGSGGDVFVLNMGKPVRIYDLAVKMIQLSGLQVIDENNPDGDIEIKFTGIRPGEKLYEELLVGNNVSKTENEMIMRANEEMIDWATLSPILTELSQAAQNSELDRVQDLISRLVPEFKPNNALD